MRSQPAVVVTEKPEIRTTACVSGISLERGVKITEVREHLAQTDNVVWMDVQSPGPDEIAMLCAEFGFHPMSLKDSGSGRHRPKFDARKTYLEMVIFAVLANASDADIRLAEIDLFVGANYLVTVHNGPVSAIDDAMMHWSKGGAMLREGVGFPFYCVLESAVAGFSPTITAMEEIIEDPRHDLGTGSDEDNVERLLAMKRTLFSLRRVLYPMRDSVQMLLRREPRPFPQAIAIYFEDVHDQMLRLNDLLGMELDMLNGTLDAHLTIISSKLNRSMRALTVVTVAIGIGGLIFAAWGVNMDGLPFRDTEWGFWLLAAVNFLLITGAIYISRKRGWL